MLYGSGPGDPYHGFTDTDPAPFVSELQDAKYFFPLHFFANCFFEGTVHLHQTLKIKRHKEVTLETKDFLNIFAG